MSELTYLISKPPLRKLMKIISMLSSLHDLFYLGGLAVVAVVVFVAFRIGPLALVKITAVQVTLDGYSKSSPFDTLTLLVGEDKFKLK